MESSIFPLVHLCDTNSIDTIMDAGSNTQLIKRSDAIKSNCPIIQLHHPTTVHFGKLGSSSVVSSYIDGGGVAWENLHY